MFEERFPLSGRLMLEIDLGGDVSESIHFFMDDHKEDTILTFYLSSANTTINKGFVTFE